METKSPAWSYSAIKAFEQCPKKYFHLKVGKDFVEPQTANMGYGKLMHRAAEDYVGGQVVELDPQFSFMEPALEKIKAMPGEKHCELRFGLTKELKPCKFFDNDVWLRSIIDLLIIDGENARVIDYKTGGNTKYADTGQLELMALCVFKHFPQVKRVQGGLLYVLCNSFIKDTYTIEEESVMWQKWLSEYHRLEQAHKHNVWNPNPTGLCKKHCIVTTCPHNGRN